MISRSSRLPNSTKRRAAAEWSARNLNSFSIASASSSRSISRRLTAQAPNFRVSVLEAPSELVVPVGVVVQNDAPRNRVGFDVLDPWNAAKSLGDRVQRLRIALALRTLRRTRPVVRWAMSIPLLLMPPGRLGHFGPARDFRPILRVGFGDDVVHMLLSLGDHFAGSLPKAIGAQDGRAEQRRHGRPEVRQDARRQRGDDAERNAGQQRRLEHCRPDRDDGDGRGGGDDFGLIVRSLVDRIAADGIGVLMPEAHAERLVLIH